MDQKSILLVEDNPADVKLTLRALRRNDIPNDVIVVEDGVEALDYLFATGKYAGRDLRRRPALVLLDLKLPRMDGMEVLRRMHADARTATIPVVILSSSREERDLREAYRCGVNSYVCKPVDFAVFNEMARELSRYWLQLNEAPSLPGG